jgi:quercetin dioxygenase-like cupin family protein
MQLEKSDLLKIGRSLEDRKEFVVSQVEDLNVYVTSYVGEYPAHKHPKDEFFFILEGELQVETNHGKVVLAKGEGLKIPRETVHKLYAQTRTLVMKIEPVEFPFVQVKD